MRDGLIDIIIIIIHYYLVIFWMNFMFNQNVVLSGRNASKESTQLLSSSDHCIGGL